MIEILAQFAINSDKPIYIQLYEYIKNEILLNNIKAGVKLPSVRELSKQLNISKNTVEGAYNQLLCEGYLKSIERKGTFVEKLEGTFENTQIKNKINYSINTNINEFKYKYDFSNAQIDLEGFPYRQWKNILSRCISYENKELLLYGEHQGDFELREQIAKYLYESRGVRCSIEQILIGSGTQQSLSMLCLMLKDSFKTIAMEEPGYVGAREVFLHYSFKVEPISLEQDGININDIEKSNADIIYITPSHQFPMGMVMSAAKRLKLIQLASDKNALIIEDDYDGEFRYNEKPIPSLQGMDSYNNVIYMGTFSKSLIPSIRISYMVLPNKILDIYKKKLKIYEQPVSRIDQLALKSFMEEGYWDRHIRRMRNIYRKKHDTLIDSIKYCMGNNVEIIGEDAGLHILLKVKNSMNEAALINAAKKFKVKVNTTSQYYYKKPYKESIENLVFIGFGGIKQDYIKDGIILLNKAWFTK